LLLLLFMRSRTAKLASRKFGKEGVKILHPP